MGNKPPGLHRYTITHHRDVDYREMLKTFPEKERKSRLGKTGTERQGTVLCLDLASINQGAKKAQYAPFCVAVIVGRGAAGLFTPGCVIYLC